jgi:Rrf2 family iron-sulfur cluster assembly transcriptional regulator
MAAIEVASEGNKPVSLVKISDKQEISLSYLEQIFAKLRSANVVSSVRGPGGGYILSKKKENVSIAEIIKAIGEPIKMTQCNIDQKSCKKNFNSKCKTHHLWSGLEDQIYKYLNSISLKDICK